MSAFPDAPVLTPRDALVTVALSLCEPLLPRAQVTRALARLDRLDDSVYARILGTFSWGLVAAGITPPALVVQLPSGAGMSTYGMQDPGLGDGVWIAKRTVDGDDWTWFRYGLERSDFGGDDADDADLDVELCALPPGLGMRDAALAAAPMCGLSEAMFTVAECRHVRDRFGQGVGACAWYRAVQLLAWQLRQEGRLDWPVLYRAGLVASELELGMDEARELLEQDINSIELAGE